MKPQSQKQGCQSLSILHHCQAEHRVLCLSMESIQGKGKIEMVVQRRPARYVTNRYRNMSSVTDMWDELNWESLERRRTKIQLTLLYKIMNGMVDIPTSPYVTQASARTRLSHTKKLRQISSRTDAYKYSFFPSHHTSLELIASFYS